MNKAEFKAWICDNYNVCCNCACVLQMLDSVLDYAEELTGREGDAACYRFLCRMFPSFPESIIRKVWL